MPGITELNELLKSMSPEMQDGDYVFSTVKGSLGDYVHLNPLGSFMEQEGLSLILKAEDADKANLDYAGLFKQITLTVHSSLEAVGLTAAFAEKLTSYGISANVVAAYFHDHIFVSKDKAALALEALNSFSEQ